MTVGLMSVSSSKAELDSKSEYCSTVAVRVELDCGTGAPMTPSDAGGVLNPGREKRYIWSVLPLFMGKGCGSHICAKRNFALRRSRPRFSYLTVARCAKALICVVDPGAAYDICVSPK